MARHIRDFAPGLVENSTPDYCEIIFTAQNCQPMSHTEITYGNHCLRWCSPWDFEGLVGAQKTKCEHKCNTRARYAIYTVHGSGGSGWGSCCCMFGVFGGPGAAVKGCVQLNPGEYWCMEGFRAGCCLPSSGHHGCSTGLYNMMTCCISCACRGNCGYSACNHPWHCCHQENAAIPHDPSNNIGAATRERGGSWTRKKVAGVPWTSMDSAIMGCEQGKSTCTRSNFYDAHPAGTCWWTHYQAHCHCFNYSTGPNENAACGWVLGYDMGFNPAMSGQNVAYTSTDEKDNIPYGGHCFPEGSRFDKGKYKPRGTASGYQSQCCRGLKHGNKQVHLICTQADHCAANAECMYKLCTRGVWHVGWIAADWCGGYQDGICGSKWYTGMNSMQAGRGMGHGTSGPRWFNSPIRNATMQNATGDNWSYMTMCSWGTGDAKCGGENIHATGFGGAPAFACAGNCYCSGPPGDGMITFRYRGY